MGAYGPLERAALRLAGSRMTRRQALGAAAAGSLAVAVGAARPADAQVLPACPPPNFPQDTQVCSYVDRGTTGWICCRQDQVCCNRQPLSGGGVAGCCEPGQTCCYSPSLGVWGCCGCPRGLHHCGPEALGGQCCRQDQVCDVVDFVCRDGDECSNVLCGSVCCQPGEVCAGGSCCQASKGCGGTCCGRGEICAGNACKQLVDYKKPPRRQTPKHDKLDSPKLQTFDADLAAELNYQASTAGGSGAGGSARRYRVAYARVHLRAHQRRVVTASLTRRARRELRRGRAIPTELTLTFRDPKGRRIVESSRVRIVPARRA
jgi:hypothetical protein